MPARMPGIEARDAVEGEQYSLAIDDELLAPVLGRGLDDPRIAVGPSVAAPRDQTDAIPVTLEAEALAVIFDFMQSDRAIGDGGCTSRKAKLKRAGH